MTHLDHIPEKKVPLKERKISMKWFLLIPPLIIIWLLINWLLDGGGKKNG